MSRAIEKSAKDEKKTHKTSSLASPLQETAHESGGSREPQERAEQASFAVKSWSCIKTGNSHRMKLKILSS
jgi:hypothetical protein